MRITMALPFGASSQAREGLARALCAFVTHLMGTRVRITPLTSVEDVDLRWYVGLDQIGVKIGDALWRGEEPAGALIGLFRLEFDDAAGRDRRCARRARLADTRDGR